jgi:hypothetical protein
MVNNKTTNMLTKFGNVACFKIKPQFQNAGFMDRNRSFHDGDKSAIR